ncbi:hypothetical protein CIHG_04783 [Coccidioides immitis H538.4]|uniref:Uncharacterized protein n=1 Tax=Coccidioides immitis H538.4 TaxID=396776 RepID=A0A0J8RRB5_COCIT|nr:hypothetical protein CIHG_04783 [Coccidioides immitis H538.4]
MVVMEGKRVPTATDSSLYGVRNLSSRVFRAQDLQSSTDQEMPGLAMDGPSAMASRATVADMHYDPASASQQANGGIYRNGIGKKSHSPVDGLHDSHIGCLHELPPELSHITLGFFPFNNLISRVVQQSWNDLNELLNEDG